MNKYTEAVVQKIKKLHWNFYTFIPRKRGKKLTPFLQSQQEKSTIRTFIV